MPQIGDFVIAISRVEIALILKDSAWATNEQEAKEFTSTGTNFGIYARYCDVEVSALVVAFVLVAVAAVDPSAALVIGPK
jgi:hypothetical protein